MRSQKLILTSVVVGVLLNVVLSFVMSQFATEEQVNPPNGAANLPFFSQIMHMLVHHKQVLVSSSVVVALLVGVSVYVACCCCNLK